MSDVFIYDFVPTNPVSEACLMDKNIERHRMIKAELRQRGITLADIAEDLGKKPTSISGCCLGRFYSQAIQEEVSRRIERIHTDLFKERYDEKGAAIPQTR